MSSSPQRTRPQQERSHQTRMKVEAAALTAIELYGRDRFTTKHVSDIAGVSIGSVYRYFPDRVAILEQVAPVPSNVLVALGVISRALEEETGQSRSNQELREALLACSELLAPQNFSDAENWTIPTLSSRKPSAQG